MYDDVMFTPERGRSDRARALAYLALLPLQAAPLRYASKQLERSPRVPLRLVSPGPKLN